MKILFFEWGSYLYKDIEETLKYRGIKVRTVSYRFRDFHQDDFFVAKFNHFLEEGYDAVFSVNFFPLVARCCFEKGIKYISWSSDCPMQISIADESFAYPTNYVFFFDRNQCEVHNGLGFKNGFHMPLAVNDRRLSKLDTDSRIRNKYTSDISMVGKLYETDFDNFIAEMDPYRQGYIEGIVSSQLQLYGAYILNSLLNDSFAQALTDFYTSKGINLDGNITSDFLCSQVAKRVTNRERILLLKLLSNHFSTKLYSDRTDKLLDKVSFMGTVDYQNDMNHVFRCSKINLNITLKCITSGIPQRAIDIMGAGGFLLSNYQPELAELFEDGQEMLLYGSIEEAYDLCQYYLTHEDQRLRIANAGHEKVCNNYTYDKQLAKILSLSGIE